MTNGLQFFRYDTPTFEDGPSVQYRFLDHTSNFMVRASRSGVTFADGGELFLEAAHADLNALLDRAGEHAKALRDTREPLAWDTEPPCVVELRIFDVVGVRWNIIERREITSPGDPEGIAKEADHA